MAHEIQLKMFSINLLKTYKVKHPEKISFAGVRFKREGFSFPTLGVNSLRGIAMCAEITTEIGIGSVRAWTRADNPLTHTLASEPGSHS